MKQGKRKTVKKTARRVVATAAAAHTTPAKDKTFTRVLLALKVLYRTTDGFARLRLIHPLTLLIFAVYLPGALVVTVVRTAWLELRNQYKFVIKIMRPYSDNAVTDFVAGMLCGAVVGTAVYFLT